MTAAYTETRARPLANAAAHYYLSERIFNRRWGAVFLLFLTISCYAAYTVMIASRELGLEVNIWDVGVNVLTNRLLIHHGLINLFIYLISDLSVLRGVEPYLLLRVGSRWRWFVLQMGAVIATASSYLFLLCFVLFSVAIPILPWSLNWSPAAIPLLSAQGLPAERLLTLPPLPTIVFMLILLGAGWLTIGVVSVTASMITQKAIAGFIAGLILHYGALLIWLVDLRSPLLSLLWLNERMFLWPDDVGANSLYIIFIESMAYWGVWLVLSMAALLYVCRRIDFVGRLSN